MNLNKYESLAALALSLESKEGEFSGETNALINLLVSKKRVEEHLHRYKVYLIDIAQERQGLELLDCIIQMKKMEKSFRTNGINDIRLVGKYNGLSSTYNEIMKKKTFNQNTSKRM